MLILHPELKKNFSVQPSLFHYIMGLRGKIYRELDNRRTQLIELNGKNYFLKQHFGVGWKEIFKNLLQGRLPIISAKNEWQALARLKQLSIPAPEIMGYGSSGVNPARCQSFLITRALPAHQSLEELIKIRLSFRLKHQLIQEVARIARILHENGINHRDFYLCHFLLDTQSISTRPLLYLIDLHRAHIRKKTPARWVIKDLAGLYFSSRDGFLTERDLLRFMKEYRNQSLKEILKKESHFWRKVKKRGDQLYEKHG